MEHKWLIHTTLAAILALAFNATIGQAQTHLTLPESHRYHLHSAYMHKA
jgi:hypothetical protein